LQVSVQQVEQRHADKRLFAKSEQDVYQLLWRFPDLCPTFKDEFRLRPTIR
jgi:hypothetical protein